MGAAALRPRLGLAGGSALNATLGGSRFRVLEIFLQGGMDPRYTLLGQPSTQTNLTVGGVLQAPFAGVLDEEPYGGQDLRPTDGTRTVTSSTTWAHGAGYVMSPHPNLPDLGAAAWPLHSSGLTARMRLIGLSHTVDAHSAAQVLTQTGGSPGRARSSGLAAAVQRLHGDSLSAVVLSQTAELADGARRTGHHGNEFRPLFLRYGGGLEAQFSRAGRAGVDVVRDVYFDRARASLSHASGAIEAPAYEELDAAYASIADYESITTELGGLLPEPVVSPRGSAAPFWGSRDAAADMIDRAITLLADTDRGVEYIHLGVGNFDNHYTTRLPSEVYPAQWHLFEFWRVARALASRAETILSEEILVVLNTEFGRYAPTAYALGADHWPRGYAAVLIGGPITTPGYVNPLPPGLMPEASGAYGPTDLRAAVALAAGVDPFHEDMYSLSDCGTALRGLGASAARDHIATTLFGL